MPATTSTVPGTRAPRAVQIAGFFTRPTPYFAKMHARYGDMFRVHIADEKPWVVVSSPEQVKQVFTGSPEVFHAGKANSILLPFLGDNSVLLLDGKPHMTQRKLLLPAFHGERMSGYGDLMREAAEREVATWPVGQEMALAPHMQSVTLEVIMRAVFGLREGSELDHVRDLLVTLLHDITKPLTVLGLAMFGPRRYRELGLAAKLMKPADDALFAEFARRRAADDLADRDDILSLLMQATHEDGSPMSDQELRDELMTLLVAGHETTATSLSWAVERLIRHPDKLARLQAELDEGKDEYLDAVVKETLRLRPVLPVVLRDLQEDARIGGHHLPAGTRVACSITIMHRRPELYPNPHAFEPERFLDVKPGTYTWIPFGGGIRRCLGASFALFEMKQVLPAIIQDLHLEPAAARSEQVGRRLITLIPKQGARVVVRGVRERASAEAVTMAA
ncbi:MAG: cytochrome P450 [Solirubrobacteraceae bacterium]|nr:cytochrome P450 [Solirubrobacteraceae bacterium]